MSLVFPNPIDYTSKILFKNSNQEKLNIQIININGQIILEDIIINNSYDIGNKNISKGVSFYSISNGSKILSVGKLLKM